MARRKPKMGRPKAADRGKTLTATKPWAKAKVSRATWYRRQAERAAGLIARVAAIETAAKARVRSNK